MMSRMKSSPRRMRASRLKWPWTVAPWPPSSTPRSFRATRIEKYGECDTILSGEHGDVGTTWNVANVSRALHSVAATTGKTDKAKQDVLFNNRKCVVVPPGVVDMILKSAKPVAQYDRQGNLYIAKMRMSGFTRPVNNP